MSQQLADQPLLAPAGYNDTAVDLPQGALHTLFTAQALRTPQAVALVCGERELTYRRLDGAANALAHELAAHGVRPGDVVGLYQDRSLEFVVAVLAVLKAGGVYVPLDPRQPASRRSWILADTGAVLLLTDRPADEVDFAADVPVLALPADVADAYESAAPDVTVPADQAAYIMYTSGSSGTPKGVVNTHRNVTELAQDPCFGSGRHRRVLAYSPLAFDSSTYELWVPLLGGGTAVVLPVQKIDIDELGAAITRFGATAAYFTTALFDAMAQEAVDSLGRLEEIWTGGDVLSRTALQRVLDHCPDTTVIHAYGPTESTVFCSYQSFGPDVRTVGSLHLGRPMANTRMYVLDERLRPAAPGAAGELFVAGDHLAHGYAGRPALTAERFVADPYGPAGSRMYRTGDLARWTDEGTVEFLGRADQQVKLRGFRIEPGEVEAVLTAHPAVAQAAVVVREDRPGDKYLAAYLVPGAAPVDLEELRAHASAGLPEYMVPAAFVVLDVLPLTSNGKLDRRALPAPDFSSAGGRAAATDGERLLCGLFAEVLGLDEVAADSDFFQLGGHSLLAAKLIARLRRRTGHRLGIRALFDAPTPAGLARMLDDPDPVESAGSVPRRASGEAGPLSPFQSRLWFADRLAPDTAEYLIPVALRISGDLDVPALEQAVSDLVTRHEALRVRVVETADGPLQYVDPPAAPGYPLPVTALTGAEDLDRFVAGQSSLPMDLATGPVFRAALGSLSPTEHVLVLCLHHIVSDDWSLTVVAEEIERLYAVAVGADRQPPAELPVQFPDVAAWQAGLTTPDEQVAYWESKLAGMPQVVELPADRPRPATRDLRGGQIAFEVPPALTERLAAFGRARGATLFMTLLAGFQVLVSRYTGEKDFGVGTPVAGREHPDTEALIGFFVNTLVMRAELGDDPGFGELLERVRESALQAYEHQDVPFDRVVEALQPARDLARNPLVQLVFALQTAATASWRMDGLSVERIPAHSRTSKFDLFVSLEHQPDGGLSGQVEFPVALFDAGTVERLAGHFVNLLEALAAEPETPVSRVGFLDASETAWLDERVNSTSLELGSWSVPGLVSQQALTRPAAPAVTDASGSLTYAQLEARSNQVAAWLRGRGVTAETPVAVCFERGLDVPVVLLGILKAGGHYLPLDADYPADRIAYMLDDTRASLVLAPRDLARRLPVDAVVWEDVQHEIDHCPEASVSGDPHPDQLAYVMYTSGSTGRPKGVQITHRNIVRLVHGANYTHLGPDTTALLLAPLSFDASTFEIWGPLANGGKLAVYPPGLPTPDGLRDTITAHEVTTLWLTAGLFHSLVDTDPQALAGVRHVLTGGDVVSPGHVKRLMETTGAQVGDGYGPTECTTFTCVNPRITPGDGPVPIGAPVTNTRVYVVDQHLNRVPVGVVGELMVAGPGLARGYHDRPAMTAERFIANPFEPGARMYRTGDLARILPDGQLEFAGRADRQIKIRGFRIEPAETETHLETHPHIDRALVRAHETTPGDKRLVAYLTGPHIPAHEDLRAHCRDGLPDHLHPAAFVTLTDGFPLDPNGKIDHNALPAPDWHAQAPTYTAPRTLTEQILTDIWADVLDLDRIGIHDNFFDLGGHSLLATRMVALVRRRLGADLGVRALFRFPTVASLAVEVSAGSAPVTEAIPTHQGGPLPLSPAQAGLWFADRLAPGSSEYLVSRALRLTGELDLAALRTALDAVVTRHEPLRTRFPEQGGQPVQIVEPAGPVPLEVVPVDDVHAFLEAQVTVPLSLADGPVFRAVLGRVDAREHVLLLCVHHIAADGWSLRLLSEEISAGYAAALAGEQPRLPELPVRYGDVAAWQAAAPVDAGAYAAALAGVPQVVELPTEKTRPAVRDTRGALHCFTVPAEVARRAADLAKRRGVTPFMVMMGAFQVLVSRYTGMRDFAVGTPAAGRQHPDTHQLVGQFVNTLVLRSDLSGEPDFHHLLSRVRESSLTALDHQGVPFDRLVEELQPARDLSRNPLVQLVFALEKGIAESWELPGLQVEELPLHTGTSKFDLFLALREQPDGSLGGSVEYPAALFEPEAVERFARHYTALLTSLVERPHEPVGAVPLLGAEERHELVWSVNDTAAPLAAGDTLHGLIAEQAARTPDAIAVVDGDRTLTYRELDAWANAVALRLRALGVAADVPVGVRMDRSPELMAGLLGVLKAGGAYVPIETDAPDARALGILADAQAPVCLVNPGARVPESGTSVFVEVTPMSAEHPPQVAFDPDNLVSVYYTSGSTGRPKGVASTHRGWVNRMRWMQDAYRLRPDEAVLQKTTLVFDDAAVEVFWPLLVGARVVMIEPGLHRDPVAIRDAAIRHRVAVLQFVPSMLTLFLECLGPEHQQALAGSLRHVVSSGEALSPELLKQFMDRLGGAVLHNQWGATEVSIDSTARHCSPADLSAVGSVSVGSPIANNEIHVLDEYFEPVPVGVPGDLYIAGVGLARGYHADPVKTAEAFLPSPFVPGERIYRTGDRGFRRADGSITFLGRQDDQVKIRGIRVEPGEVEQVLLELPGVREAAVTVWVPDAGDKRLAGYVVPKAGVELDVAELRLRLRDRLPSYLVPAALTVLDEFPTTTSGKIDRKLLPRPEQADPGDLPYQAPEGALAELVAEVWAEVLGVPRVGAHDNFFDLGGHSLLAVKVLAKLRERTAADLSIREIFDSPTVTELAEAVGRAARRELAPIRGRGADETVPLLPAQRGMWFADQLAPEASEYLVPFALRIRGPLDVDALSAALGRLVERHEVLRTRIVEQDGRPVQLVDPAAPVEVPVTELAGESGIAAFLTAAMEAGVDIAGGPVLRAAVARLSDTDHVVSLCLHHLSSDGWSTAVLAAELENLYGVAVGAVSGELPPPPVQYGDVALWEEERAADAEERLGYWESKLAGMPQVVELPADRPRPATRDVRGGLVDFRVPAPVVHRLARLGQARGATLFMTLLAGFQVLVSRYTGEKDFGVGTPVAGRQHPDTEALIGQFVNTLVMRAELGDDPGFGELLQRVRESALQAYEHQDVPFDRVVEALQPQRDATRNPLTQTMFALQTASTEAWRLPGLDVEEASLHSRTAKFDLSVALRHAPDGGLSGQVEFPVALFDAGTVERLAGHFVNLLEALAAEPETPVSRVGFLDASETAWLAERVNGTSLELGSWSVPGLVSQQALTRPAAPAVTDASGSLTYAQLEARSNQVAAWLRGRGVTAETPVAVCFERGLDVPVVLLGILKAGGHYLPLDADYPADRIAYMLDATRASLVLAPRDLAQRLPVDAVVWEDVQHDIDHCPTTPLTAEPHPDQLAYVMYTSGSTGRPKGVQITHRNIVRLVHGANYTHLGPDTTALLLAPLSFDASTFELWGPLANGGQVAVYPPGLPTPDGLRQAVATHRVTTLWLTAGLFHSLVDTDPHALAGVRHVLTGGDVVSPGHVKRLMETTGAQVGDGYGPTECTTFTCVNPRITPGDGPVPIGAPVTNTRVYVVDQHLNRVPVGVVGELMVAGPGLARGYHDRPAMTAERFIANPFEPGARMYRTGDLARILPDGQLEFAGRADRQIKIRGFRIEPAETETHLETHPHIDRALVRAHEATPGDKRLVAYLTGPHIPPHEDLRAHCRDGLPDHLHPTAFITLTDGFPLDPNGKIDHNALPAPDWHAQAPTYTAPRTLTEQILTDIWADVLDLDRIGIHDNFFDLGGHSLLATRVRMRLQNDIGVDLPIHRLFAAPVLAELAVVVDGELDGQLAEMSEDDLLTTLESEA